MGNNNSIKKKYNDEKDINLNITLNKVCYFPGEIITGFINIQPKIGLNETILNDTSTIIKLIQMQEYSYTVGSGDDERTYYVSDDSDIVVNNIDFINFKGANILLGINIPFSILIPSDALISVYTHGHYIKHFIYFELPGIYAKRTLMIFIKGYKQFTLENKLLKIPATSFGDFYKKKKSKFKGGKVSCFLKIPKNSFTFFEIIPFEIYLDKSELNMEIKNIKISINRAVYFNYKEDLKKHDITDSNIELVSQEYPIDNNKFNENHKYEIKDDIQFPKDPEFWENLTSKNSYSLFENMKQIEFDYNFKDIELLPFCVGGLISVEYLLKVEINYKDKRSKSIFSLPIEFYENDIKNYENIKIPNNNIKNNQLNQIEKNEKIKKDNNGYYNINSIDEEDPNENKKINKEDSNDFVVYEEEDFEKIFLGEKKK